jgi:hypothetical protein
MVVVPTSHHVSLSYGTTPVDYEGWALTLLALIGLAVLVRRPVAPVLAVRRTGMVRMPGWTDPTVISDAIRGAWGSEPSPPPADQAWPVAGDGAAGDGAAGAGNGAAGAGNGAASYGESATPDEKAPPGEQPRAGQE